MGFSGSRRSGRRDCFELQRPGFVVAAGHDDVQSVNVVAEDFIWSARRWTAAGTRLDGLELGIGSWSVTSVEVRNVRSAFFEDPDRFPSGSAAFDHALLMRDVPAIWKPLRSMPVPAVSPVC